ncbi:MAG: hypothetical protein H7Z74_11095 [Anaerolineae bacterium]|nr:hypothetical protein [Gemmatimonadaceae bacterium]
MQRDPLRRLVSGITIFSLVAAAPVAAQILERPAARGEPRLFISAAAGVLDIATIGDADATLDFGTGFVYRASVEHSLGRGSAIGVAAARSRIPLRASSDVLERVDAHATVTSIMASFRGGGGVGFHQVFLVQAGALRFTDIEADDDNTVISRGGSTDFAFSIGGGFGYGVNARLTIGLVQELGLILHRTEGSSNNSSNSAQQRITRIGASYGFGTERRR